jgi:hypothetical protein
MVVRILVQQSFEVEVVSTTQEAYPRCGSLGTIHHIGSNSRQILRSRRSREFGRRISNVIMCMDALHIIPSTPLDWMTICSLRYTPPPVCCVLFQKM